jgi:isocitrate lyase
MALRFNSTYISGWTAANNPYSSGTRTQDQTTHQGASALSASGEVLTRLDLTLQFDDRARHAKQAFPCGPRILSNNPRMGSHNQIE